MADNEIRDLERQLLAARNRIADSPYVIVRCRWAGVFAGFLEARGEGIVTLRESRRLWDWKGALTLTDIAENGVAQPKACKFTLPLPRHDLLDATEILYTSDKGRKSIEGVPVWKL